MMKWIFFGLILISLLFGAGLGRMGEVSSAVISSGGEAIQLGLTLAGAICLWSGVMRVASQAKLTELISQLFAPFIRMLFKGLSPKSAAAQAICLNISANLLGLGNAATPLGIAAMSRLSELNGHSDTASDHMCMFVVLNTASLQIIPTTIALLRANAGSAAPMEIMPASWAASGASILTGIFMVKLLSSIRRRKGSLAYDRV